MKDTNGDNITEEEFMKDITHGTSPQPEEWESRFDNAFAHNYLIADEKIIEDVHNRIKSFIKDEIRKAEEKKVEEMIEKAKDYIENYNVDGYHKEFLEALKK